MNSGSDITVTKRPGRVAIPRPTYKRIPGAQWLKRQVRTGLTQSFEIGIQLTKGGQVIRFVVHQELKLKTRKDRLAVRMKKLSERESQITQLVVQGHDNQTIARKLHIAEKTVKFHLTNIYKKYKVRGRNQLIPKIYQASGVTQLSLGI